MRAAGWLFWLSVAWLTYVWIGYPLLLWLLSGVRFVRFSSSETYVPTLSVLIAARNEEKDIGWKLAQTLAWNYPSDRLQVLVGSDASTDGTDDVIRGIDDPRVTFVRNHQHAGKNLTLNRLAQLAGGEILFFTDANTYIGPDCAKALVRHFVDPRVGCVTGMERNIQGSTFAPLADGSNAYLEYESLIDSLESRLGSVLVCDGSVYCLRHSLFSELDSELANDLEQPIRVGAKGFAVLFESQARSFERVSSSVREEFARRRRIVAQGALAAWKLRHELCGVRLWQFISRKCMRWFTLLPVMGAFGGSFVLREAPWFTMLFAAEVALCALVLVGAWRRGNSGIGSLARLAFAFLLAAVAALAGVFDACRRKTFATWNIAELSRGVHPQGN
jgi:cellulose synthase/poly-beta-1,6-N-acetylglucosamine synthase-like glycosyltransferase